jgi:hypothetical protein
MTRAQKRQFHKNLITPEFETYLFQQAKTAKVTRTFSAAVAFPVYAKQYYFYKAFWRYVAFCRLCKQAYDNKHSTFNCLASQIKQLKNDLKGCADELYLATRGV